MMKWTTILDPVISKSNHSIKKLINIMYYSIRNELKCKNEIERLLLTATKMP